MILAATTLGLYVVATFSLQPPFDLAGDAPGYLEAMRVLNGMHPPDGFIPNRILTTFGGVSTVAALAWITGNYLASWFFVNTLYFFGLAFVSYFLFRRITGSDIGSILGALFLVGNYDVLVFGLNYLMDISGWFWFMLSLLFLSIYMEGDDRRFLWGAALAAGVGTLFKEYAFFAFLPLGVYLLYRHWRSPREMIRAVVPCAVSLLPLVLVHIIVYLAYGYSYFDWYGMNTETFAFEGWAWNAGRSFLVVLGFMLPVSLLGIFAFVHRARTSLDARKILFVVSLALPALAVFLWPIITERLVFLFVPLAALLAAFAVARYERHWPWFAFIWLLYVMVALKTDGLILSVLYGM
jgi:4-amino-4-deoxy-L-arabinose transferase-like glycosyltransferase